MEDWRHGGFGLYIHWPFCQSKCPYCDFNSHVAAHIDQSAWADAYLVELDRVAALTPDRVLNSVFFGGGTPSLMAPETVHRILERVSTLWTPANDIEITLEANPGSVEAGRFRGYQQAGVNRISMGVQSLRDADLTALGRLHSVAEAKAAFDIARGCFDRVSFDLIYARQNQTMEDWRLELTEALSMAVDHLSLYQLTIEDGTAFAARHAMGGLPGLPDDDRSAEMFELTQELCDAAGMSAYEVSNHARAGAESRHNLIYWRTGDWAAIGPGAHGRLTLDGRRITTEAVRAPGAWLKGVVSRETLEQRDVLSGQDRADEALLMGLRLTEGFDLKRITALRGSALNPESIAFLQDQGLVEQEGDMLRTTLPGRMVLNAILRELIGA